ncbi:UbiA family prenyltransferase [Streptomyces zhihengii]|uniref:UbiA family prenyltransferase n=1 Tax=Streptomyces zhihengii TaxID=1818004 RepID=A0ABS2ULS8_9ACTN|nr:UbiA family prenyltransferase [Streptomyces zhihengii]
MPAADGGALADAGPGVPAPAGAQARSHGPDLPATRRQPGAARGAGAEVPPAPAPQGARERLRAWAELLRVSALFSVPGDALAGAAAVGARPGRGTALAVGASLCLYEAGMALNDWADREEDAAERPHRPVPSGRIAPRHALVAAGVLTAAGLTLAARAGRPALAVATALSATVWAYDLRLKHTPAGPAAMATARALDLLLGATATLSAQGGAGRSGGGAGLAAASSASARAGGLPVTSSARRPGAAVRAGAGPTVPAPSPGAAPASAAAPAEGLLRALREALPAAGVLGVHTYAVTAVSRHEVHGGSTRAPLAALAAAAAVAGFAARHRDGPGGPEAGRVAGALLAAAYARTAARPFLHAALNPSPQLTQRAVGGGIRAMIPLQAALAARSGAATTGLAVMGLVPLARRLARKVSPT